MLGGDNMKEVRIMLSVSELEWCRLHAETIVNYYGDSKGSGAYNHNRVASNLVGVKSEVGVKTWFEERLIGIPMDCNFIHFKNKKLKGDIRIRNRSIEIKGLRNSQWARFKRCIPPKQLNKYCAQRAIVIWTTTAANDVDGEVILKGWNYANDVKKKGKFRKTICDNICLADDADMRNLEDLIKLLKPTKWP